MGAGSSRCDVVLQASTEKHCCCTAVLLPLLLSLLLGAC